jgi:hypothetical protein
VAAVQQRLAAMAAERAAAVDRAARLVVGHS